MSAACCGERHERGIVSVRNAERLAFSSSFIIGMIVVAAAIQIVTTRAAPLSITTRLPTRRRRDRRPAVSATVIGLLSGGRVLSALAALYSLSRRSVVTRAPSGHLAQCNLTAESGGSSRSEPVASSARHCAQVIATARYSSDGSRADSREWSCAP